MKKLMIASTLALLSLTVMAEEAPKSCFKKAEKAVKLASEEAERTYDRGGIEALSCVSPANKNIVVCDIRALKGGGEANDSYYVILNKTCSKALRVQMTGEE